MLKDLAKMETGHRRILEPMNVAKGQQLHKHITMFKDIMNMRQKKN